MGHIAPMTTPWPCRRLWRFLVGDEQALVAPREVDPHVVHPPAGGARDDRGASPLPTGPFDGEGVNERSESILVLRRRRRLEPLGGAWLADNAPRPAPRDPNGSSRMGTARRRRPGARRFPGRSPSTRRCRGPGPPRRASGGHSRARVPSISAPCWPTPADVGVRPSGGVGQSPRYRWQPRRTTQKRNRRLSAEQYQRLLED